MAKRAWWDIGGIFGTGEENELQTKTVVTDPTKKAVSEALGSYYTSRIGKGLSPYAGDLTTELDPLAQARYSEYLGMSPEAWFKKAVTDPTLKAFERDVLPEISETWAGYQSGSGRGWDQLTAVSRVAEELGTAGAKAIPSIYESQLKMGYTQAELDQYNKKMQYTEWLRQQPEYNPVLEQALKYAEGGGVETFGYWDEQMSFMDALDQMLGIGMKAAGTYAGFKYGASL